DDAAEAEAAAALDDLRHAVDLDNALLELAAAFVVGPPARPAISPIPIHASLHDDRRLPRMPILLCAHRRQRPSRAHDRDILRGRRRSRRCPRLSRARRPTRPRLGPWRTWSPRSLPDRALLAPGRSRTPTCDRGRRR